MRKCINSMFKCDIKDIMTGYRAFSYDFVKTFPILSTGFEIETEMTIHAVFNQLQIENVVVEYKNHPNGSESKLNTYSDGYRVIKMMVSLYKNYKPFAFFSIICGLLTILAVGFSIPVFITFFQTGVVPRIPTLIVCGFVELAALQAFFTGLVLSNMTINNRRDFEQKRLALHREK